jgi:hypothetical protein
LYDLGSNPGNGDNVALGCAWALKQTAGPTGDAGFECTPNSNPRTMGGFILALKASFTPGSTFSTTFTSNETFTVPSCVTSLTVEAWGGGGGGRDGDSNGGGKGGGGGGYAKGTITNASGVYSVTVGTGGTMNNNGTASTFGSTLVVANGGTGGTNSTTGGGTGGTATTSGVTNGTTSSGGAGGNGNNADDVGGGGGGAAGPNGNGAAGAAGASNVGGNGGRGNNNSGGTGGTGGNGGNGANGSSDALGGGGGGGADNGLVGGNGGFPGGGGGGGENGGGSGANGLVKVTYTLPSRPTITLTNTATACFSASAQNVTLAYSGTAGCPNQYSIDFASGIADITNADLSGSPITISLPANLPAGTYNGDLTVKNSTYGFVSIVYTISITVNAPPPAVGAITGSNSVCVNQNSLVYSVEAVSNATNYTWTVPSGWSIVSGQGSTSITASAGGVGTGNITVQASNSCGISAGISAFQNTISPLNETNNTGFVTSSVKTDGNIQSNSGTGERRGFIKFPLSAIPAGSTIISSTLTLTNNNSTTSSTASNDVKPLGNVDPVTTNAATLFSTIGAQNSGTIYSRETWSNTGVLNLSLNATAVADIQSRFASPGYIAMGLARGGTAIYNFFGYSNSTNSPKLIVNYTLPAGSLSVTVNALPTLSANTGGAATVCVNATTAAFTNAQAGGTWSIVAGTGTASVSTGGVVTGLTAGTVSLVYTYSNGTCSNSVSSSLTVNATPAAPTEGSVTHPTCRSEERL